VGGYYTHATPRERLPGAVSGAPLRSYRDGGQTGGEVTRGTAEPWRPLPLHLTSQHHAGGHGNVGGSGILAPRAPQRVKAVKACEGNTLPYHSHYSPIVSITCRTVKGVKASTKRI